MKYCVSRKAVLKRVVSLFKVRIWMKATEKEEYYLVRTYFVYLILIEKFVIFLLQFEKSRSLTLHDNRIIFTVLEFCL